MVRLPRTRRVMKILRVDCNNVSLFLEITFISFLKSFYNFFAIVMLVM